MSHKLLFASGEQPIAWLVAVNLRRASYEVATARDGEEAIARAKEEKPDLIIFDDDAWGAGGCEARRKLAADPETKDIRVTTFREVRHGGRLPPG